MDWRGDTRETEVCIMAVTRKGSFEIDGQAESLLEPAVRALVDMRCSRFARDGLTVKARTGWSWRSMGEIMSVTLVPIDDHHARVEVESTSALGTVLLDWGVNAANLRRFEAALKSRIAGQSHEGPQS